MLIYLLIYTFMQLGAFAVIVVMRRQDVVGDELKDFSGLHFRNPFAAFAMLLFMLSLGGIPPTAGFMGKFWLFGAAIDAGYVWLAVIGVLNSAISLYYYVRIVVFMYLKKETTGSEPTHEPGAGGDAGRGGRRRRWCSASIRGCCSSSRRRRRGRSAPAASRRRSDSGECGVERLSRIRGRIHRRRLAISAVGEVFHKVRYTRRSRGRGRSACSRMA